MGGSLEVRKFGPTRIIEWTRRNSRRLVPRHRCPTGVHDMRGGCIWYRRHVPAAAGEQSVGETGGEARAAHCPPATRLLLACQKKWRGRGARERLGQRSRIFRWLVIARPLAVCPRPHFAAGAPNLSCPPATHSTPAQLLCGSPAGPVHKRTGLMRTEAGAGGGACACERLGHLCMVEPSPCRRASLRGRHVETP